MDGLNSLKLLCSHTNTSGNCHRLDHVQALHQRALVGCAVAEEIHDHPAVPGQHRRVRGARGDRKARTDDAVGTEDPLGEVGHVHRAAHATADAGVLGPDLRHHRRQVPAFGEVMAVTAMGAGYHVPVESRCAQTPVAIASSPM